MSKLLLLGLLAGCLPVGRPHVELEPGASLAGYVAISVRPVVDESGWPFPFDIRDSLKNELAQTLRRHGYTVVASDSSTPRKSVLVVQSDLKAFVTGAKVFTLEGGPGGTRCGLVSTLIDESSGHQLGTITAAVQDQGDPFEILMACARSTGDELARRVRAK